MVEVLPDLIDLRGGRPGLADGPVDVVKVLPAAGEGAVGGGDEGKRVPHAGGRHVTQRVAQGRRPVPVAPVDRQGDPAGGEVLLDGGGQVTALLVDRADPAE